MGTYLETKLYLRRIGREGRIAFPPWSLNMNPSDLFARDYMEDFVFFVEIASLSRIKLTIKQAIECISTRTLQMEWKNMNSNINNVVSVNGGHVEQDNV